MMQEEKLTDEEAKLSDQMESGYQAKLAEVKAELEEKQLAEQMGMANEPAKEERPDPEQIFTAAQLKMLRAEVAKAVNTLHYGLRKAKEEERQPMLVGTSHAVEEASEAMNLIEEIVALSKNLEAKLAPVLMGPTDEPEHPGGSPVVAGLTYIRYRLEYLSSRLNL